MASRYTLCRTSELGSDERLADAWPTPHWDTMLPRIPTNTVEGRCHHRTSLKFAAVMVSPGIVCMLFWLFGARPAGPAGDQILYLEY